MKYLLMLLMAFIAIPIATAAGEEGQALDQVVVTASRIQEKVKETPVTVSVADEKEIQQIKLRNPSDILSRMPGVYTHDFGGESELTSIRVQTHFTNPYTIVLLDGVPIANYGSGSSSQFSEINTDNIARVEVIKGPASALYGSNAIGGVINVISKTPSAKPRVKAWTEVGAHDQWRSGFTGSASGEKVSFKMSYNHIDSEGWREHLKTDKQSGDISFQFVPSDNDLISLKLDYLTSNNFSAGSLKKADFETDWSQSYFHIHYAKMNKIAPSLTYNHYFENAEFKAMLKVRSVEEESVPTYAIRQRTWGAFPRPYEGSFDLDDNKTTLLQLLYNRDFSLMSSRLITGVDSERGKSSSDSYDITANWDAAANKYTSYTVGALDTSYIIRTSVNAPFAQLEASPIDGLKVTGGVRYDNTEYEVDNQIGTTNEGVKRFANFSPKLGLTYDIHPRLNTYFSFSEGFVVPTTSQLLTSSRGPNIDLTPEEAVNYEIGIRASFWQDKISMDLAAYTMDIDNKIILNDTPLYVNTGATTQEGIEANMMIRPCTKIQLAMSYAYAENKYESYVTTTKNYNGNYLPRSPKHHVNARLTATPIDNLELELEWDDVSIQFVDDANLYSYHRPSLLNLRATYDWQQWSLWSHVKNVTDEKYASYVSYSSTDGEKYYSGSPLTVFAGVSYQWEK